MTNYFFAGLPPLVPCSDAWKRIKDAAGLGEKPATLGRMSDYTRIEGPPVRWTYEWFTQAAVDEMDELAKTNVSIPVLDGPGYTEMRDVSCAELVWLERRHEIGQIVKARLNAHWIADSSVSGGSVSNSPQTLLAKAFREMPWPDEWDEESEHAERPAGFLRLKKETGVLLFVENELDSLVRQLRLEHLRWMKIVEDTVELLLIRHKYKREQATASYVEAELLKVGQAVAVERTLRFVATGEIVNKSRFRNHCSDCLKRLARR